MYWGRPSQELAEYSVQPETEFFFEILTSHFHGEFCTVLDGTNRFIVTPLFVHTQHSFLENSLHMIIGTPFFKVFESFS